MGCEKFDILIEKMKYVKRFYGLDCSYLVITKGLEKDDWLKYRRCGLTGTDIASIAGVNKYAGGTHVWLDKKGQLEPIEQNEAMHWGTIIEPIIAKEFSNRTGLKIQNVNVILQHKEYEFALGNIDRLVTDENGEKGILEIKTASEYIKSDWDDDKVPPKYMLQLQWYMFVTGVNYGYFAALIGGNKYIQKYVKRDDELIEMLLEICKKFWNENILKNIPPIVDGNDSTKELLTNMYPESVENEILLPYEAGELIVELEEYKVKAKELDFEITERENKLKQFLGENERGLIDDKKIIWKTYIRSSVDSKKLKAEMPDIYEKYIKSSSYKKFSIK